MENVDNSDKNESYLDHEGEDYDATSYGSVLQPPGLTQGYTMVHENCCRARYRLYKSSPDKLYHICLNKVTCCSLYGGTYHAALRCGQRAEVGVYKGNYNGQIRKLLSAKAGTRTTARAIERISVDARESDRALAASMDMLDRDLSIFPIPAAKDQIILILMQMER